MERHDSRSRGRVLQQPVPYNSHVSPLVLSDDLSGEWFSLLELKVAQIPNAPTKFNYNFMIDHNFCLWIHHDCGIAK